MPQQQPQDPDQPDVSPVELAPRLRRRNSVDLTLGEGRDCIIVEIGGFSLTTMTELEELFDVEGWEAIGVIFDNFMDHLGKLIPFVFDGYAKVVQSPEDMAPVKIQHLDPEEQIKVVNEWLMGLGKFAEGANKAKAFRDDSGSPSDAGTEVPQPAA